MKYSTGSGISCVFLISIHYVIYSICCYYCKNVHNFFYNDEKVCTQNVHGGNLWAWNNAFNLGDIRSLFVGYHTRLTVKLPLKWYKNTQYCVFDFFPSFHHTHDWQFSIVCSMCVCKVRLFIVTVIEVITHPTVQG